MNNRRKQHLLIGVIYLLSAVVSFISGPGPVLSGDSGGYKSELLKHDWSRVLSSFSGKTTRSWPIITFYELVGSTELIVICQFLLMLMAGLYWLHRVTRLNLSAGVEKVCLLVSVLILGSPFVWTFSFQILSEAMTLSFALVAVSTLLALTEKQTHTRWALFHGAVLVSATLRPQFLLVWILSYAILILQASKMSKIRALYEVGLSLAVVTAVLGWWSHNADYWRESTPREAVSTAYYLSEYSPISNKIFEELSVADTIPPCISISKVISDEPSEIWNWLGKVRDCPMGKTWASEFSGHYMKHLVSRPELLWQYLAWSVPRTFGDPGVSSPQISVFPEVLTKTVMGSTSTGQVGGVNSPTNNSTPKIFYDALFFLFFVSLGYEVIVTKRKLFGESRYSPNLYIALSVGFLFVGVFGSLAMASTDLEMARLGLPANVLFRLVTMLLICIQIDNSRERRKQL
jgi:hypothetical protein